MFLLLGNVYFLVVVVVSDIFALHEQAVVNVLKIEIKSILITILIYIYICIYIYIYIYIYICIYI